MATGPDTERPGRGRASACRPASTSSSPGHDFGTRHRQDQRASSCTRRTPRGWFVGFAVGFVAAACCCWSPSPTCCSAGIGDLGHQRPGRLGLRHHQLRLVDRHRPRRHADLGHPAAAAPGVAHVDQPLRRGDDAVRGRLRRALSRSSTPGRPWLAYWLFPYPNTMGLWPQFRSPLIWDVFAVSTYAHGLALFWFVGPDPRPGHAARPRAEQAPGGSIYGMLAMGWRGSARHWHSYETAYLLLAGLATPLVVSVHTVVSFDFAVGHRPRLARDDLPALLRGRRHLRRLRHGADPRHPAARSSTASRTSSPCGTSRTWPRSCSPPA